MRKPKRTFHPIDPALVSAYYDDALQSNERIAVEEHLALCRACRERLASYRWLGKLLQSEQHAPPVPARLDRRVAALVRGDRASRRHRLPLARPVWAAVAVAGLVVMATVALFPLGGAGGPSVAAAYPCDDLAECAVAVRFAGSIDRDSVERSIQLDPPVAVAVTWRGDTLLVRPAEPLQPTASYTLSLNPRGPDAASTAVAVHFVAGSTASPVAMATRYTATPASMLFTAVNSATPSPSPTSCGIQLAHDFGNLSRSQPAAISNLGCARAAESGAEVATQPFKGGRMLRRGERREIVVLLDSGKWRSYPDTLDGPETVTPAPGEPTHSFGKLWREQSDLRATLGATAGPEQSLGAVVQEFERGLLVRTADQMIYALYADNSSWTRYVDAFRDTTSTITPTTVATSTLTTTVTPTTTMTPTTTVTTTVAVTSTATIAPSTTATLTPTVAMTTTATPAPFASAVATATVPVATITPTATNCSIKPVRGLGLVYQDRPTVAARLGCARTVEVSMPVTSQTFEHGAMLWRSDQREIAVLLANGAWSVYPDTWRDGEVLADAGTPPPGRSAPQRGFGKLWRQQGVVRESLGWSTSDEQSFSGAIQEFAGGWMLRTGDRIIYVLYSNGSWQSFPDSFVEPAATPVATPARRLAPENS